MSADKTICVCFTVMVVSFMASMEGCYYIDKKFALMEKWTPQCHQIIKLPEVKKSSPDTE